MLLFKALQTLPNRAGHYRRAQRACTGLGKLYERGSVYLMIESTPTQTALSADRLAGHIATISHHLSADLQATAGRYCTPFLSDSLYSPPRRFCLRLPLFVSLSRTAPLSLSAPDQTVSQAAIWEETSEPPSVRGVSEEIDFCYE